MSPKRKRKREGIEDLFSLKITVPIPKGNKKIQDILERKPNPREIPARKISFRAGCRT